ncbi:hypothetical protein [Peribacillus simplex]|uniref:Uncharacterized protein n=1 Tax=Peribacillus simplex TaxID=1478 RepID=A0AAN2PCM8_9BACI|nr:hypothetical protein [Peribacillus simplex]CEG30039.1 hypothetical protein BN1180_00134 [Peribacillus simplex]
MRVIDEILDDLLTAATDLNAGNLSREEFNLTVDLLIRRVNQVRINYEGARIHVFQRVFNQLLFSAKFKAMEGLKEFKEAATHKKSFNNRIRGILGQKLHFLSLYRTIKANRDGYRDRNGYYLKSDIEIFVLEGGETHE